MKHVRDNHNRAGTASRRAAWLSTGFWLSLLGVPFAAHAQEADPFFSGAGSAGASLTEDMCAAANMELLIASVTAVVLLVSAALFVHARLVRTLKLVSLGPFVRLLVVTLPFALVAMGVVWLVRDLNEQVPQCVASVDLRSAIWNAGSHPAVIGLLYGLAPVLLVTFLATMLQGIVQSRRG